MKFSKVGVAIAAVLCLAAAVAPANAATITYDWTISSVGTSGASPPGAGTLTVTTAPSGADPITAFSGEIGGIAITGLAPASASTSYDNLLYPAGTPTVLDTKGLGFMTSGANGGVFSFFAQGSTVGPGEVNLYGVSGPSGFAVGNFNVTPVPLPAGWTLFLVGLCSFGVLTTRRSKKQAGGQLVGFAAA